MLNGGAKENWVLLINSDLRDHLDKLAWDILWLLVQDDVLQDLLEVLFLGSQGNRLQQASIS